MTPNSAVYAPSFMAAAMPADLSMFVSANVADTCAVWNVLASAGLFRAAMTAKCTFCVTSYVLYECLSKPRKKEIPDDRELQARLQQARQKRWFDSHSLSLADLQDVARLEARKRLGKGELSCIAFARRTGLAMLTDDTGAQKLAALEIGATRVQTSPHLFGWLVFTGRIVDGEVEVLIAEHSSLGRHRGPDYRDSYHEALRIRLLLQTKAAEQPRNV